MYDLLQQQPLVVLVALEGYHPVLSTRLTAELILKYSKEYNSSIITHFVSLRWYSNKSVINHGRIIYFEKMRWSILLECCSFIHCRSVEFAGLSSAYAPKKTIFMYVCPQNSVQRDALFLLRQFLCMNIYFIHDMISQGYWGFSIVGPSLLFYFSIDWCITIILLSS